MKALTANLKLLYQNREMLVWYFFSGICIFMVYFTPDIPHYFHSDVKISPFNSINLIKPFLLLIVLGFAIGRLVADLWTKPTFFCLPGQIKISIKIPLIMGLSFAAITSIAMIILNSWMTIKSLSAIFVVFSFYLMIYWLSVLIIIRFNKLVFIILLFYLILFTMPLMGRLEILIYIQRLLLIHQWISAFVCLIVSCLIYHVLTRRSMVRSICGVQWVPFFVGWNVQGSSRYNFMRLTKALYIDRFAGFIDSLFSERIQSSTRSLILQHLCGKVYEIISYLISNFAMILFVSLAVFYSSLNLINHVGGVDLQPYYFSLFGILCGHICVIPESDILLPLSRKGRLLNGVTAVITSVIIMLAIVVTFVLLSYILSFNGNFASLLFSLTSEFISLNGKYILFSGIALPATAGVIVFFRKKPALSLLSIIGVALFILGINLYTIYKGWYNLKSFNLFIGIIIMVVSFGFYFVVLYYDSIKRSIY